MANPFVPLRDRVNAARFHGQDGGFYESFFLRANHPVRPRAFWIRYTAFSPRRSPRDTVGELWGVVFDKERGRHRAYKTEAPWAECAFDETEFGARIGAATLAPGHANGAIACAGGEFSWSLRFAGSERPLFLLPERRYDARLPAAKALVSLPMARFDGELEFDGERLAIDHWIGSQNHNWGVRHTDHYAWGQVAGFDTHPDSFLEFASARLKIGPLWTPPFTPIVLRHRGREYALNGMARALMAHGRVRYFSFDFASGAEGVSIEGRMWAAQEDFVGLIYMNPIGGAKHCLNSKIASCRIVFRDARRGITDVLETGNRAAFEILTDDRGHGVAMQR
jgi:hypothetical protein